MCICVLPTFVPVDHVCSVPVMTIRGCEIPPRLELQMVVSYHVGAGI